MPVRGRLRPARPGSVRRTGRWRTRLIRTPRTDARGVRRWAHPPHTPYVVRPFSRTSHGVRAYVRDGVPRTARTGTHVRQPGRTPRTYPVPPQGTGGRCTARRSVRVRNWIRVPRSPPVFPVRRTAVRHAGVRPYVRTSVAVVGGTAHVRVRGRAVGRVPGSPSTYASRTGPCVREVRWCGVRTPVHQAVRAYTHVRFVRSGGRLVRWGRTGRTVGCTYGHATRTDVRADGMSDKDIDVCGG